MAVIEKEFSTGYNEDIPSDLSALSMRLLNKQLNAPDILYAYAIMIYALKESLRMACQLLFGAICGGDLVVLNNDNLINIENRTSSQICNFYKVFVQGALFSVVGTDYCYVPLIVQNLREDFVVFLRRKCFLL